MSRLEEFCTNLIGAVTNTFTTAVDRWAEVGSSAYDLLVSSTVPPVRNPKRAPVTLNSHYSEPIYESSNTLRGFNREHGGATINTQIGVIRAILEQSQEFEAEDQAILLGMARIESGFNPDAAAKTTSASGVFQFIDKTGAFFGLTDENRFDATSNINAGIQLYKENLATMGRRFPELTGDERAAKIYALHHDGPKLDSIGQEVAERDLLPMLDMYREVARNYREAAISEEETEVID